MTGKSVRSQPLPNPPASKPAQRKSTAPSAAGLGGVTEQVLAAAERLREGVHRLQFAPDVPWVYNPLAYAWSAHRQYIERYATGQRDVIFLGMNPGPWGMTQTGVPFGQVAAVRDWLGIEAQVERPTKEHPKRPVEGLKCRRSEVSGERLWGLFKARFGEPENFFAHHYVANYCPLVFMEESARNVTPDKLPARLRATLEAVCDQHLCELVSALAPKWIIGVGSWAENCARRVVGDRVLIGKILHPSPASPLANRDWAGTATAQLVHLGVW